MADPERMFDDVAALVREVASDVRKRRKRHRRRRHRRFVKLVKTGAWMVTASFVIIVGMLASGLLLGPRGIEGVVVTPLLLIATWAVILYLSYLRRPTSAKVIAKSDLPELPASTEDWLERQRRSLPLPSQRVVDAIAVRLEALAPQLSGLDAQTPAAFELRRLLAEELPELVRGYQKVPKSLQRKALPGGTSPDRQLLEGLTTIEEQLGVMHTRLAADDLHALATQQRYLEIKYKGDDEL